MPKKLYQSIPPEQRGMLHSLKEISAYVGVSPSTIKTWYHKHGFQMVNWYGRRWMTTRSLIDTWLIAVGQCQRSIQQAQEEAADTGAQVWREQHTEQDAQESRE